MTWGLIPCDGTGRPRDTRNPPRRAGGPPLGRGTPPPNPRRVRLKAHHEARFAKRRLSGHGQVEGVWTDPRRTWDSRSRLCLAQRTPNPCPITSHGETHVTHKPFLEKTALLRCWWRTPSGTALRCLPVRSAPATKDIPTAQGSRAAWPRRMLWAQASLSSRESPALAGSLGPPARRQQQKLPAFSASDLSGVRQNGPRSGVQQPSEGMAGGGSREAAEDAKVMPSPAARPELSSGGAGQPGTMEGRRL